MRRDPREPIIIFAGGENGMGWAVAPSHLPEGSTYNWSFNWDCRIPGRATPSLAPMEVVQGGSGMGFAPITTVIEWEETTPFRPYLLFGVSTVGTGASGNTLLQPIADGTLGTNDTRAASNPYAGGVLYRSGDTEMAYFCNGSSNQVLRTVTKALVFANAASAKADLMAVIGSDLWIATGGYKVQRLTPEADPALSGSYLTAIPVGRPTYPITALINLNGSLVVYKGDGIFVYRDSSDDFECVTEMITPHPDHGKGGFTDGRGRAYYPTADDDIIVLTAGFQGQQRPARFTTINRETPFGRIAAMTADMEYVYAVTEPGSIRSASTAATPAGLGLVVMSTDGGVFTTHTTEVTDGQFNTVANLTLLLEGTDEALYIGCDEPFLGAYISLYAQRIDPWGSGKLTVEYASAGPSWNAASNSRDGTAGFCQQGLITLATDGSDLNNLATKWVATTVNSVSKYWMRIYRPVASGGTGLQGVQIKEVLAVPYRPPLDVTTFPISQYALGGALPKILVGTWQGETILWHDVWTLDAAKIDKLIIGHAEIGAIPYARRCLYALNHEGLYAIPLGFESHPAHAAWPKLGDYGEAGTAQSTHIIGCSGIDFGGWVKPSPAARLEIDFPHVQGDDTVLVHSWWDDDAERVFTDQVSGERSILARISQDGGRVLHVSVAFSDATRDAIAPYLNEIKLPGGAWVYSAAPPRKADQTSPLGR